MGFLGWSRHKHGRAQRRRGNLWSILMSGVDSGAVLHKCGWLLVRDETEYNPIRRIRATAVPGAWCPVGEPESRARDPRGVGEAHVDGPEALLFSGTRG